MIRTNTWLVSVEQAWFCSKCDLIRTEVLCTPSSTQLGIELMTPRSWQYISCHWDTCYNHSAMWLLYACMIVTRMNCMQIVGTLPGVNQRNIDVIMLVGIEFYRDIWSSSDIKATHQSSAPLLALLMCWYSNCIGGLWTWNPLITMKGKFPVLVATRCHMTVIWGPNEGSKYGHLHWLWL